MNGTPAHFLAVCPSCLMELRVNHEYSGRRVACRHCGEAFRPYSLDFPSEASSDDYSTGPVDSAVESPRLEVTCPGCSTSLSIRASYVGRHVRCDQCKHKFLVNDAADDAEGWSAPTPDPDDPHQGRVEVLRLMEEVASLHERNARLEQDVDRLQTRIDHLEAERRAAHSEIAALKNQNQGARNRRTTRHRFDGLDPTAPNTAFAFLDDLTPTPGA